MSKETIIDNDFVTLWFHPETKIVPVIDSRSLYPRINSRKSFNKGAFVGVSKSQEMAL